MIHVYGIAWKMTDYIRKSIESMVRTASEPICMTVIENKSDKSPEIKELLEGYVNDGIITRALLMEENTIGWGLLQGIRDFNPPEDEKFFVMTDLDLIVPDGCDWIKEMREAHEVRNCTVTGCTLDLSNYDNTPNHGYGGDADSFGMWMIGVNTDIFMNRYPFYRGIYDVAVRDFMAQFGRREKLLSIRLYHEAWDLWKEGHDPEYFKHKKDNPLWAYMPKPENMNYELLEIDVDFDRLSETDQEAVERELTE